MTGRNQKEHDVIAYHLRQSFKPGEITPELANKIGYDLAMSLTKGKHAFIVCTHTDKEHIHSHIVFNSTSLDCSRKFNNFWGSSFAVRRISDLLCLENGLSVIDDPRPSRGSYGSWLGEKPPTVREQLAQMIDAALTGCKDFDSFLAALKELGVEVKRGKHLAFKIPGGKKFIRCSSLGEDYTEAAILERISGKRVITPVQKQVAPNLLIDIQAKLQQAHSPGFERWASVFNLKEMAKTLNFLQEHGLMSYADLVSACDAAAQKYVRQAYSRDCMMKRNRYLVDHSSILLAVYNGTRRSGTGATVRYAQQLNREIIMIDPAGPFRYNSNIPFMEEQI